VEDGEVSEYDATLDLQRRVNERIARACEDPALRPHIDQHGGDRFPHNPNRAIAEAIAQEELRDYEWYLHETIDGTCTIMVSYPRRRNDAEG
jgi:hypothetical protein